MAHRQDGPIDLHQISYYVWRLEVATDSYSMWKINVRKKNCSKTIDPAWSFCPENK